MDRVIKFRGLRTYGKGWVYGDLLHSTKGFTPIVQIAHWTGEDNVSEVIPETVGQFTGLTDKNGNEVYEGDCLHSTGYLCKVSWADGCFRTVYEHPEDGEILILGEDIDVSGMEVIGNIHEESEVQNG